VKDRGVATSGTYVRGQHIYNPVTGGLPEPEILSITVIGADVCDADGYATAAFAMGRAGIGFVEAAAGLEGYMIDSRGLATFTSGFGSYVVDASHPRAKVEGGG
jgi:thiamine biosynthesis lipoprotein